MNYFPNIQLQVTDLTRVPDYDEFYSGFNCSKAQGVQDAQIFRFCGVEGKTTEDKVYFTYKDDARVPGWMPRYYEFDLSLLY